MSFNASITHCPHGHEYTEENVRMYKDTRVCRACAAAKSKAAWENYKGAGVRPPSLAPKGKRKSRLRMQGWTPELFDKVWEEQDGLCAICYKPLNTLPVQNKSRACADHEYVEPPKPRGILCTNCNIMIGQAKESPQVLRCAAQYLEKYSLVNQQK